MPASQSSWGLCKLTSAGLAERCVSNVSTGSRVESTEFKNALHASVLRRTCWFRTAEDLMLDLLALHHRDQRSFQCSDSSSSPSSEERQVQTVKQHDPQPMMRSFGRKDVNKCCSKQEVKKPWPEHTIKTGIKRVTIICLSQVYCNISIFQRHVESQSLASKVDNARLKSGGKVSAAFQFNRGECTALYRCKIEQHNVSLLRIVWHDPGRKAGRQTNAAVAVLVRSFLVRVASWWSGCLRLCLCIDWCLTAGEEEMACVR